jgi:TPR repeat protein
LAYQELKRSASLGEGVACNALGCAYAFGHDGFKVDMALAESFYKKGLELGYEQGIAQLGRTLIARNLDVPRGEGFLEISAALGNVESQFFLGTHCLDSATTDAKKNLGFRWLEQASQQGHTPAMHRLAHSYEYGHGVEIDTSEAMHWLEEGSRLGSTDCQATLGLAYSRGEMVEQDKEKAHLWFHLASLQGNPWATHLLGLTYESGDGVEQDIHEAIRCFIQASPKVPRAKFSLARIYYWDEHGLQNLPKAIKWLKLAADEDVAEAQALLGEVFLHGQHVEQDYDQAAHWYALAAEGGCAFAARELALLQMAGLGVAKDQSAGVRNMMKAAGLGDEVAMDWVKNNLPGQPDWLQQLKNQSSTSQSASTLGDLPLNVRISPDKP